MPLVRLTYPRGAVATAQKSHIFINPRLAAARRAEIAASIGRPAE